jgi:hypothetical protein
MRCWTILGAFCLGVHELPHGPVSSQRRLDELHELPHGHLPRHDRCDIVGDLCSLYCWELLRCNRAFSGDGFMRRWAILGCLSKCLHELCSWSVSSYRRLDELHELPHRNFPGHDWCVVVGNMCILYRWKLLRHNRAFIGDGCVRRWAVLGGLCLGLHELFCWPVSSERCLDWLHKLPHGHLPRHHRRVVVDDLRGLHCRKLLRRDGTLGSHGDMRSWAILGDLSLGLHELPRGTISSGRRIDELHELPHRHLSWHDRSVVVGDLRSVHRWKLLRHSGSIGRYGYLRFR